MMNIEKLQDKDLEGITGGRKCIVDNTSAGYARIREAPDGEIIDTVSNGRSVYTDGEHHEKGDYDWYHVYYDGGEGWIAGSLIGF